MADFGVSILEVRHLSKRFGTLLANDDISFSVLPGEIHALVGENGAGKSTLMKCLYGLQSPSSGEIRVRGERVDIDSPRKANALGIGMVHQHFMLVPSFPVYRNVVLGDEPHKRFGVFDQERAIARIDALSKSYGLEIDPQEITHALPVGIQQRVEILKILYREAEILIFDEPTAVLSPQEVASLFDILRAFRARGKTIIFIAHKLSEVLAIADRISVLRQGRMVGTVCRADIDENRLAEMMVGETPSLPRLQESSQPGEKLLSVDNLWASGNRGEWALRGVSLTVSSGEILGIAGVMGNGQSELEECLWGLRACRRGQVFFRERDITATSVSERREAGMAYIPEDRIRTGLAVLGRLWENLLMGHQTDARFHSRGALRPRTIRQWARSAARDFTVKATSEMTQAGTLSGGNMQKLVLAREMRQQASFLLISQPTRGVDVGGISFIHERILEHRRRGGGALLLSSDLDEVLALSDRIAVMYRGRLVALLSRAEATRELVGRYMLKGA